MTNPYRDPEEPVALGPKDPPDRTWLEPDPGVKARVEVAKDGGTVVVKEKEGELNWRDKAKNYYKGIIVTIGAILALLAQVTPLANMLGQDTQNLITGIVLFLTALLTFLKSNEQWVQKL